MNMAESIDADTESSFRLKEFQQGLFTAAVCEWDPGAAGSMHRIFWLFF